LVLAAPYRVMVAFAQRSVPDVVRNLWDRKKTGFLLRHYLYESQSQYVKSYLMRDRDVEYLKVEPSEEWQTRLQQLDGITTELEAQARVADVPLVVLLVPERAQAAMISMGDWPTRFDPYKLDNELRSMIITHGGTYIDILPALRHILNPEKGYFSVDGHPNAQGHAMISRLLATELTSGAVPALKVATQSQAASGQGR
jgi:hypothetical protein